MNTNKLSIGLVVASIVSITSTFAQKIAVTDAAVEYKNRFLPALMSGKIDEAKASLISAKEAIDKAALHPETAKDPKMLYYKGEIYGAALMLAAKPEDTVFIYQNFGKDAMDISIEAFRESYKTSKKFQPDINESVDMKLRMIDPMAGKAFDNKEFKQAGDLYYAMYKLLQAKNIDELAFLSNAAIAYSNAGDYKQTAEMYAELAKVSTNDKAGEFYALSADAYTRLGDYTSALAILQEGKAKLGNNKEVLLEIVRVNLAQGNKEEAEKSLNDAIAADPSNKQLHYIIGTIYTDLNEFEKAEAAFAKALEIDPNYKDVQYNLGAMLVTWAQSLNKEASAMNMNDWRYDATIDKAEKTFERAVAPLEKFVKVEPNNPSVLMVLFQINQNLGNTEKAKEYKARYDATQK